MQGMFFAPFAEFFQFNPVLQNFFILFGMVIDVMAFLAFKF